MFSINYSTAKTLMRQYKFNMLPFDITQPQEELPLTVTMARNNLLRCGYRDIVISNNVDECKKEEEEPVYYHSFSPE